MSNATLVIESKGDESVGIPGTTTIVELPVIIDKDETEFRKFIVDEFSKLFEEIIGEKVRVYFDDVCYFCGEYTIKNVNGCTNKECIIYSPGSEL